MTVEEREIANQLRDIKEILARLEDLLTKIALGLGVNPNG